MRIIWTISLIIFCCFSIKSQESNDAGFYLVNGLSYDDLYQEDQVLLDTNLAKFHESIDNDSIRIEALAVICENMYDAIWIEYQKYQLKYLNDIMLADERLYFVQAKANGLNNVGFFYDMEGKSEEALDYYNQSLQLFTEIEDSEGKAITCNNIGFVSQMMGNIPKALDYFHKSLVISEKDKNLAGVAYSSNNLGTVYDNKGDYELAIEYYRSSYETEKLIGNREGEAISLSNMGYSYSQLGDQEKALEYFLQAYEIRKEVNDLNGMANSMNNIGSIYKRKKKHEKAREYFLKGLDYTVKQGNKLGLVTCYNNLAGTEYALGNIEKAKQYSDLSVSLALEFGYPTEIVPTAQTAALVAEKQKNWKRAYDMYKLWVLMKDSLKNDKLTELTIQYQYELEYEKKASADSIFQAEEIKVKNAEIAANQAEADKQKVEADSQRQYNFWLIAVTVLFAVFLLVLFNRFSHTRKQNEIIKSQKLASDKQRNKIEDQHVLLEETHREISDSIKYAQRLQDAILPAKVEMQETLGNSFVIFNPKDVVSGDFYWMHHLTDLDRVLLAVADCTGHGVPGAMVSVVCSNALNRSVKEFGLVQPSDILNKTRELVVETFSKSGKSIRDGMDISLISLGKDKLIFSGANNPVWLIRNSFTDPNNDSIRVHSHEGKSLIEVLPDRQPVGFSDIERSFTQVELEIEKDDTLFLFTDGFADQFGGPKGKKFKYKPFKNYLLQVNTKSMEDQKTAILETFNNWKGDFEQVDDVCIVGVKV